MKLDLTPEQKEELKTRILDFDDWVYCGCSEFEATLCDHGVLTEASLERMVRKILEK